MLGHLYDVTNRRQITATNLQIKELQESIALNASQGNFQAVDVQSENISSLVDSLAKSGVSAKSLNSIIDETSAIKLTASYKTLLDNAYTPELRKAVMKTMAQLPNSKSKQAAFKSTFSYYNQLNELYKDNGPSARILEQSNPDSRWQNLNVPKGEANKAVAYWAQNMANKSAGDEGTDFVTDAGVPVAVPDNVEPENVNTIDSILYALQKEAQTPALRKPNIFELGYATAHVGAKNSTLFKEAASNQLIAGSPEKMAEAVRAIDGVLAENKAVLELDDDILNVYSNFKLMMDSGRTDFENMANEARLSLKIDTDTESLALKESFKSKYSGTSEASKRAFKSAFNQAGFPFDTSSEQLKKEFSTSFARNFIVSKGNSVAAIQATKIELERKYKADSFSRKISDSLFGASYETVKNSPTLLNPEFKDFQIRNQFLAQLVDLAERNPKVRFPKYLMESYATIKDASNDEMLAKDYSRPRASSITSGPLPAIETGKAINNIRLEVQDDQGNWKQGRLFTRSNILTDQNDTNRTVYEAWVQTDDGGEMRIPDPNSPYANQFLVQVQPLNEFSPSTAEDRKKAFIKEQIYKYMKITGRTVGTASGWEIIGSGFDESEPDIEDIRERQRAEQAQFELADEVIMGLLEED